MVMMKRWPHDMTAIKNPAHDFCGSGEQGLDKTTGEIIPLKPSNRRVFKFGMTTNPNEAGPGAYVAKCTKVDLDYHFRGAPKIALNLEIIEGYETGKVARMFFNNPGAQTGEIGSGSKIYQTVKELYPEIFFDGKAEIDLITQFENHVYEITVIAIQKKKGGSSHIVDSIKHPETHF